MRVCHAIEISNVDFKCHDVILLRKKSFIVSSLKNRKYVSSSVVKCEYKTFQSKIKKLPESFNESLRSHLSAKSFRFGNFSLFRQTINYWCCCCALPWHHFMPTVCWISRKGRNFRAPSPLGRFYAENILIYILKSTILCAIRTFTNTSEELFFRTQNFLAKKSDSSRAKRELRSNTCSMMRSTSSTVQCKNWWFKWVHFPLIKYLWKLFRNYSNPKMKIATDANESLPSNELKCEKLFPPKSDEKKISLALMSLCSRSLLMPIGVERVRENGTEQFSICVPTPQQQHKAFSGENENVPLRYQSRASFIKAHSNERRFGSGRKRRQEVLLCQEKKAIKAHALTTSFQRFPTL